ncbi:MAG: NADH dehydrogenase (quinone) subunit D [Candidatus Calescibacterium sp.]|jgi:NADH (or F420H2) dehydrogenase, subunit C
MGKTKQEIYEKVRILTEGLYERSTLRDMPEFVVKPQNLIMFEQKLKEDGFNMILDLFGVDFYDNERLKEYAGVKTRFAVIYHFLKIPQNERVRVIVPADDSTPVPSSTKLFRGADWFEREVYDLLGIKFEGHPDLRRIMLPEDFEGHPLRKDFPTKGVKEYIGTKYTPRFVRLPGKEKPEDVFEEGSRMIINVGPTHPATHGTFRMIFELEGEDIIGVDLEIGYLHRGVEKNGENMRWEDFIPMTDRLNYLSAYLNNMIYTEMIERWLGIWDDVPRRAKYIRVILGELSRIADHLVSIGTMAVDLGALTPFWYFFKVREEIYSVFEWAVGARLTTSGTSFGGVRRDLDEKTIQKIRYIIDELLPRALKDVDNLLTKNRIFIDRTRKIGVISAEEAIEWGFTGPSLRGSGVAWDIRKVQPYGLYDEFDFEIPIATEGDVYSRYLVRMEEMVQSAKIIRQALDNLPDDGIRIKSDKLANLPTLPDKKYVYTQIEALIHHFKGIVEGVVPPYGWYYFGGEAANGELGFFAISVGKRTPWRIRIRPPCFAIYQAFRHMVLGHKLADFVAVLGSINIVAGELDR